MARDPEAGARATSQPAGRRDPDAPDPNERLVIVFDTDQESEAMVVHGLLESAGIESLVSSLDAPQDVLPGVGGVVIRVREEQADEARRLIDEYRNEEPDEGEISEESR
jgi:hypothetical protein